MSSVKNHVDIPVRVEKTPAVPPPSMSPMRHQGRVRSHHVEEPNLIAMPEEKRRHILWISVGICTVLIAGSWVFIARHEFTGGAGQAKIFKDITAAVTGFKITAPNAVAKDKEITNLDRQVFPQFQQ